MAEAPQVQAAHEALGERMRIVGVVSGPDSSIKEIDVERTVVKLGLSYDQVRDRDLTLTRHFGVKGTPTVIILTAEGEVAYNDQHVPDSWEAFL